LWPAPEVSVTIVPEKLAFNRSLRLAEATCVIVVDMPTLVVPVYQELSSKGSFAGPPCHETPSSLPLLEDVGKRTFAAAPDKIIGLACLPKQNRVTRHRFRAETSGNRA
jgi:hypothetical protein